MARQLRIEYPGAFYHVFSRGNRKQPIFLSDHDRSFFLRCLMRAHEKFDAAIHVYCLMDNHYHLMVETPNGRLSRTMHLINLSYSAYFNAKNAKCGHLFQGRFKAILVEAESYALGLSLYIHRNPVRENLAEAAQDYLWSSCREYLGLRKPPPWLDTSLILRLCGGIYQDSRINYASFIAQPDEKYPQALSPIAMPTGILGTPEFVEKIRVEFLQGQQDKPDREIPDLRRLKKKPDLATILWQTHKVLGTRNRFAKRSAIYLAHKNTDHTLKEIGEFFGMSLSGTSEAARKMNQELSWNNVLAQALKDIEHRLGVRSTLKSDKK